jgi:hypothetical protein
MGRLALLVLALFASMLATGVGQAQDVTASGRMTTETSSGMVAK